MPLSRNNIYTIFSQSTAALLYAILTTQVKPTFYKINVHAAMTPTDIENHLRPAFELAMDLKDNMVAIRARNETATPSSQQRAISTNDVLEEVDRHEGVNTDSDMGDYMVANGLASANRPSSIISTSTSRRSMPFVTVSLTIIIFSKHGSQCLFVVLIGVHR